MEQNKSTFEHSIFRITTERPVAILMVVIGVFVFGLISYKQLALNLMPEMTYPSLTVRTEYPGTAPEEVETTISRPVEQALGVVDNLVSISSISKAEQSDVILEFTWDTDMNKATADVREKLDQVFLPLDAKRPIILRYDPSLDPIIRLGLYGDVSLSYLRYLGEEEIKRALETIDGVAAVKVKGGLKEEIRVELDEQKLSLIGVDIQAVRERLAEENINMAGGKLKEGETEYLVRTLNEFRNIKEIENIIIGRWNGVNIKIKDVGKVIRTSKEREIITRIGGKESVEIEIYKEADANIVEVARRVKERLYGSPAQRAFVAQMKKAKKEGVKKEPAAQKGRARRGADLRAKQMTNFITYDLPKGINIKTLSDQSVFIENSINDVKSTAIQGGLLAILVLFVFLRKLSPTVIIGISIPLSIVATFAPMKIFNVSLNIMSLGGLALGIGMLVDNSIVVLESIARCREEGDGIIEATIRGVREVGGAVTASTLTTIAVFFPIVFVQGVAGQVFGDLALTVVFSLLASLLVALFLIPMLSSRQVDTFIRGTQISKLPENFILDFQKRQLPESIEPASAITKFLNSLLSNAKAFVFGIQRIVQIFGGFFLATGKGFLLFFLVVLQPIAGLIRFVKRDWDYGKRVKSFAAKGDSRFLGYVSQIWKDFLSFNSVLVLYDDFSRIRLSLKNKSVIRLIVTLLLTPFKAVFYLIKFVTTLFMELFFRFFHSFLLEFTIISFLLIQIFKLILAPVFALLIKIFNFVYSRIENGYPVLLRKSLKNRYSLVLSVFVLFLFTILVIAPRLGSELIPEVHQGEFFVEVRLPVGTPVEETDRRIEPIQERISQIPGVQMVSSLSGTDKSASTKTDEGENTARITVTLKPTGDMARAEERVIGKIRKIFSEYSGMEMDIARPVLFSFKTPIEVHLKGFNLTKLQRLSHKLEERMSQIPGLVDVRANIQRGNPEVQVFFDRQKLARHGLNVRKVAEIIRNKIQGDVSTQFKEEDRRIDILVRLREADRESIDDLKRLVINPTSNIPVSLESVAHLRVKEGPSEIRRIDQQRSAVITANLLPGYKLNELNQSIFEVIQKLDLPADFSFELAGQNKEMETSLNSLMMALALAIFLVYIVMASQFESLIHPFIIIFTIPLAIIGVVLYLYFTGIPLSIVVFLGLIMLAGIVVNNAIVLVDYINHLRRNGMSKVDAIIQAGRVRLRPILMTASTTVLGLLPMALGFGEGAEIRTPMAITVIVGLITSTLLTLVVIPMVYDIVNKEKMPRSKSLLENGSEA
ncbi:MAG: efflux RND transporter permease subunit [Calditrichaeota bacterium]|nr:efflux RND transporter permease subunit [Calditrichota bacterium]